MDRSSFALGPEPASGDGPKAGELPSFLHLGLFRRFGGGSFALAAFWLLAGCVDGYIAAEAPQPQVAQPSNMARREGVSPSGVTVAVASFAGAPDGVRGRFASAFDSAAKTQDIVMATPAAADYLVRGYLNAVPEGDGTAVTYVLDIFDAKKHRTQRVEDQILLKAKAADPWSVVDDNALTAVAAKSAAALAAVLTNTPGAILAAGKTQPATATTIAEGDGRTMVASTPPIVPPAIKVTPGGFVDLSLH